MDAGEWRDDLRGTPQGSVISPILANVYLHYVLDLWFQKKWRSHEVKGDTIIVRYADDFVVGFQHKRDADVHFGLRDCVNAEPGGDTLSGIRPRPPLAQAFALGGVTQPDGAGTAGPCKDS